MCLVLVRLLLVRLALDFLLGNGRLLIGYRQASDSRIDFG